MIPCISGRILSLVLAVEGGVICMGVGSVQAQEPQLHLFEHEVVTETAAPNIRVATSNDSTLITWDPDANEGFRVWTPGERFRIGAKSEGAVGASFSDGTLMVITGEPPAVTSYTRSARLTDRVPLASVGRVSKAVFSDGLWYLLSSRSNGRMTLWGLSLSKERPERLFLIARLESPEPLSEYHMHPADKGVLVTSAFYPFEGAWYTPFGSRGDALAPPLPIPSSWAAPPQRGQSNGWISLPILPLDVGHVQVLSDLRSDHRVVVTYGSGGGHRSTRSVQAPWGLVASLRKLRMLVGARDLGGRHQIVLYEWRWSGDP